MRQHNIHLKNARNPGDGAAFYDVDYISKQHK